MPRPSLWLRVLLLPLDLAAIAFAIVIAYSLRSASMAEPGLLGFARTQGLIFPLKAYLFLFILSIPIWVLSFAERGLYDLRTRRGYIDEAARVVLGVSTGLTLSLAALFITRTVDVSRYVILNTWWLAIVTILAVRLLIRVADYLLVYSGLGTVPVAVILPKDREPKTGVIADLIKLLKTNRDWPWRLAGLIGNRKDDLGDVADIPRLTRDGRLDELWLLGAVELEVAERATNLALTSGAVVRMLPERLSRRAHKVLPEEVFGLPLLRLQRTPLDGWGRVVKRSLDVILGGVIFVLLLPVMAIIALLIKLDSKGPVIYSQARIGENGRPFMFLKFRSMVVDADKQHEKLIKEHGNMFKLKDDPRQTRIGRFLRKSSLDELPQLINVLRGEMSLVGPRPPMPVEVEKYSSEERRRLGVKPGMTGLWQVSGRSLASGKTFEEWVELDAYYIEHWSLWLDLKIIFKTAFVILSGIGAF